MPDDEVIVSQQSLLATYRQTLAHLTRQAAFYGGEPFAPPVTAHGLAEARANIARIKAELRMRGRIVADEPNDMPPSVPSTSTSAPSIPSAEMARGQAPSYSCFVSYSHEDDAFVQQLVLRLQSAGLNVWYANDDLRAGVKLYDQITEAIRRQDKLLVVLSAHSMASEWVTTELRRARREEVAAHQRKLFPIRLVDMPTLRGWEAFDADLGKDLAIEVREYFIPDFSNWQDPVAFETAVTRLLKDLQASAV